MKSLLLSTSLLCSTLFVGAGAAYAAPINAHVAFKFYDFTITNPQGTVQGTFDLTIDDVTGNLSAVTGVNFEIAGYHYTSPSQLLFGMDGSQNYITGNVNEWFILSSNVDDFYFSFDTFNPAVPTYTNMTFGYAAKSSYGTYWANRRDPLQITPSAITPPTNPGTGGPTSSVPDSGATAAIMGLSLLGLACVRRWTS